MGMNRNENQKVKVFISYRWNDYPNLAQDLHTNMKHDYDCFLDKENLHNNGTISDIILSEIENSDCLIMLLTERSLERLEEAQRFQYAARYNEKAEKDYVYFELTIALQNNLNIIPVVLESFPSNATEQAFEKRLNTFFEGFGRDDGYDALSFDANNPSASRTALYNNIRERLDYKKSAPVFQSFEHMYWVGTRKSDIPAYPAYTDDNPRSFAGSISLFGDKPDRHNLIMCPSGDSKRVDHNDPTDIEQDEFIVNSIEKIIEMDNDARFLFYNQTNVPRLGLREKFGADRFPCVNEAEILNVLNNKKSFRNMMKNEEVSFFPVKECSRYECRYDHLLKAYQEGSFAGQNAPQTNEAEPSFIIQAPVASGGDGTFILNKNNEEIVLSALNRNSRYLVSIYYKNNIPINCHAVIYKNDILISTGSVQLIRPVESEHKLLYKGADFVTYRHIPPHIREEFRRQATQVAKKLQSEGYRGVCGIDAIIYDDCVYLMEVNGRFQASTELLNRVLLNKGEKTVQELHYNAFYENRADSRALEIASNVPFSNYSYSFEGASFHDAHIFNIAKSGKSEYIVDIHSDGYTGSYNEKTAEAYLFRLVFRGGIASINKDRAIWMNENIVTPERWLTDKIKKRERLALKLALLIQGVAVDEHLDKTLREATNNAVDLQIEDMVINAPTNIKFVEFTPFTLKNSEKHPGKCRLYYYGELLLDNVGVFPKDPLQNVELSSGKHISSVAYLSTDRLRVHTTNQCIYKCQHKTQNNPYGDSCRFCNIKPIEDEEEISLEELHETVAKYIAALNEQIEQSKGLPEEEKPVMLRHFLIGGQSLKNSEDKLVRFAEELGNYHMPIYAMTLPLSTETIIRMIEAGVYEFAFNIEIFDKECREEFMPGKGKIPVEKYISSLKETVALLSSYAPQYAERAVRSMILVGLEPYDSMMDGIKLLIQNRIEPMLSVFRPLPDTELFELNAPPIRDVYHLFEVVSKMLYEASLNRTNGEFRKLGPRCRFCQNNTVSLPWYYQTAEIPKERQYAIAAEPFTSPE